MSIPFKISGGERAGSGVPNIFNTWEDEGFVEPEIEERFDPDRTVLSLAFKKKQAIKASDKTKNIVKIREFLQETGKAMTNDIEAIGKTEPEDIKFIKNNFSQSK